MWLRSAIAVVLSLGSTALAQGSIGGDQVTPCAGTPAWKYRGCYTDTVGDQTTRAAGFVFKLSTDMSSPYYYPNYTGNITPSSCQMACRGHGYRYAATYAGGECYCASSFPNPQAPVSGSTASGPGVSPSNTISPGADVACNLPCKGDITTTCGGLASAAVYEDPTFNNNTSLLAPAYYGYLGCYQIPTGTNSLFVVIKTPSTVSCETYCGSLGYAYSGRSGPDGDGTSAGNTCACGTEIFGYQQPDDTRCRNPCNVNSTL